MKKAFAILILLLALPLSACGFKDDIEVIKELYINPAIEEARHSDETGQIIKESPLKYNVITDRTKLSGYVAPDVTVRRLTGAYQDVLTPSEDYGNLLPYVSDRLFASDGSSVGSKYGLLTANGEVVLDEVLTDIEKLFYQDELYYIDLGIYKISRFDSEKEALRYALLAEDGSWVTEFEYEEVIAMSIGVLAIYDEQNNLARVIGPDGKEILDSKNFATKRMFLNGSVASLANHGEGYFQVVFQDGSKGYVNSRGSVLNMGANFPSFHTENKPFRDGLGVVAIGGDWRYMKENGEYAFTEPFAEAYPYVGDISVVRYEGNLCILNRECKIVATYAGASELIIYNDYISVDGRCFSKENFKPYILKGAEAAFSESNTGIYSAGSGGIWAKNQSGDVVFLSGASSLVDTVPGIWLVRLANGEMAAMNSDSQVISIGEDLELMRDEVIEGYYVRNGKTLTRSDGRLMTENMAMTTEGRPMFNPTNGCVFCYDGFSVGWINSEGTWLIREVPEPGD